MKYYLPTFDDIVHLREEHVDEFLTARRVNSMYKRSNDSMGSFCALTIPEAVIYNFLKGLM